MNTFAILLLCTQAYLVQNVYSQCGCAIAPAAISPARGCGGAPAVGIGYGLGGAGLLGSAAGVGYGASGAAAYGGVGEGNVAVAGELPVAGNTAVAGVVPILGAVSFGGNVPAAGCVSINGRCACGCGY